MSKFVRYTIPRNVIERGWNNHVTSDVYMAVDVDKHLAELDQAQAIPQARNLEGIAELVDKHLRMKDKAIAALIQLTSIQHNWPWPSAVLGWAKEQNDGDEHPPQFEEDLVEKAIGLKTF